MRSRQHNCRKILEKYLAVGMEVLPISTSQLHFKSHFASYSKAMLLSYIFEQCRHSQSHVFDCVQFTIWSEIYDTIVVQIICTCTCYNPPKPRRSVSTSLHLRQLLKSTCQCSLKSPQSDLVGI